MPRARKSSSSRKTSRSSGKGPTAKDRALIKSMFSGTVIGVVVFGLSVLITWFVALGWIKNYLKSEEFNSLVAEAASEALKSEAQLAGVSWNGEASSVYADVFQASGYEDASFSKLEINGLSADFKLSLGFILGCIRDGAWKIPQVQINQLNVYLSDKRLAGTYEQAHPKADTAAGPVSVGGSGASRKGGFFSDLLPSGPPEVDQVHIKTVNLVHENADGVYQATGVEVLATPTSAANTWRLQTNGGQIRGPDIPNAELESIDFRWNPEESQFFIAQASAAIMDGRLEIDGDVTLGDSSDLDVRANLTGVAMREVVPEDWTKRFTGELEIDAHISGDVDEMASQGDIKIHDGVLTALPVLDQLARYTGTDRFRRIALNRADAKFARKGETIVLTEIFLQSDGLARLEGNLSIDESKLDGEVYLGVVPGILKWLPPGSSLESRIFKEERDGHRWTTVKVGGTLNDPSHDLDDQLVAAGIEEATDTIQKILEDPGSAKDKADELIDMGKKLLEGFFK